MADATTLSSAELISDRLSDMWETRSAASQEGCGYIYKSTKKEQKSQSGALKEKDKVDNFIWKGFFNIIYILYIVAIL